MSRIIKANRLNYIRTNQVQTSEEDNFLNQENMEGRSPELLAEEIYEQTKRNVEELVASAERKTEQIILEGKLMAEAIIEEGQAKLEEEHKRAFEEGYKEGLEKAKDDYAEKTAQANLLIEQAYAEKESLFKNSEKKVVDFIVYILDMICLGPLMDRKVIMQEVAKHLMEYVKDAKEEVVLKLSTEDYPLVLEKEEELNLLLASGKLSLRIDRQLRQGHAILISEQGILEIDLEENLEKVKAILQDGLDYD